MHLGPLLRLLKAVPPSLPRLMRLPLGMRSSRASPLPASRHGLVTLSSVQVLVAGT